MGSVGSMGSMGSVLVLVLVLGFVQEPAQITNGRVEMRTASTIEREVAAAAQQGEPLWVAWKVPAVEGRGQGCCWHSDDNTNWYGCGIEPATRGAAAARPPQPAGPVPLEPGTTLLVMARVAPQPGGSAAGGNVERVRTFGDDCPIDAGGRTIRFLEQVSPEASVSWLRGYITARLAADPKSNAYTSALSAIANTAGPAADAALDHFADSSQPANVRRQAAHWIGQARGSAGFARLKSMLARETEAGVRLTILQAMGQSRRPEAVPALIDIVRNDSDPKVRERAMFWLGQSKDPRATKFFEEILIK